jgi:hypothetical protein
VEESRDVPRLADSFLNLGDPAQFEEGLPAGFVVRQMRCVQAFRRVGVSPVSVR